MLYHVYQPFMNYSLPNPMLPSSILPLTLLFGVTHDNSFSGQPALTNIEFSLNADVYLAGTVMLIFGMGLYGLFISNVSPDVPPTVDRALKGSSLFGMFALKVVISLWTG